MAVPVKGGNPVAKRDRGRVEVYYWGVPNGCPFRNGGIADERDVLAVEADNLCRSLPDSNIDVVIITDNVRADALKVVNALTVSTKYQEILQTV